MSVSIHSLFTTDELTLELEWLKARDTLLGDNYVDQDVKGALELAAASHHSQCQRLTCLFSEKNVSTVKEARYVFLADEKKSSSSLCFAALLSRPVDEALLRQSANLGHPLAQARRAGRSGGEEMFRFAKFAASQRERDGFYHLAWCYEYGGGCEKDLEKAREFHLISAHLGSVWSMNALGLLLDKSPE
jgi:TPR repeat protein